MNSPLPLGLKPESELAANPEFVARLRQLDAEKLERVVLRVAKEKRISQQDALACRIQFLQFFALAIHDPAALAPSAAIDAFWHEFILFTLDYTAFCDRHYGQYLHHQPFDELTPREEIMASVEVAPLLAQHFETTPIQARHLDSASPAGKSPPCMVHLPCARAA